jgi:methyl-galactoside transport system ATP-binding protein
VYTRGQGEIRFQGKALKHKTPEAAIRSGFALITEERRATGLFPAMNLTFNSTISNILAYGRLLLSNKRMTKDTKWVMDSLKVKAPGQRTAMRSLSGGNQQKVIIGRWLLTKPEILLLDEPTRGIDVGAKFEIYQLILQLAQEGKGIVMVSSEMPELIGICDRILVMRSGSIVGEVAGDEMTEDGIVVLATGVKTQEAA